MCVFGALKRDVFEEKNRRRRRMQVCTHPHPRTYTEPYMIFLISTALAKRRLAFSSALAASFVCF